eukprot:Sdes_comp16250_c0_seq1m5549
MLRSLVSSRARIAGKFIFSRNLTTSAAPKPQHKLSSLALLGLGIGGAVGLTYHQFSSNSVSADEVKSTSTDWKKVREDIADLLESPAHDDGSLGPLFVRLAWHSSGTFCKHTKTGGSNGSYMRFPPESTDGANNGLKLARDRLEAVKEKHPQVSYADLYTLSGVVAIEEMGGPVIKWRPGRVDASPDSKGFPGRLPDASKDENHVRDVFYRMGFHDREIVALIGAHALGRCHTKSSGYSGPWTRAPTTFSNLFFVELFGLKWSEKNWSGPRQFEDKTGDLMMLPTDIAVRDDPTFRKYAE